MQTIHIQISDQIRVIYVARQMASQITMNPDGTHRRFTNIRQFWAHVEAECQTLGTVKAEPCVLKKLAREMVLNVSKPVMESERAQWLARFDADDARAKQPKVPPPAQPITRPERPCKGEGCDVGDCDNRDCPNYLPF